MPTTRNREVCLTVNSCGTLSLPHVLGTSSELTTSSRERPRESPRTADSSSRGEVSGEVPSTHVTLEATRDSHLRSGQGFVRTGSLLCGPYISNVRLNRRRHRWHCMSTSSLVAVHHLILMSVRHLPAALLTCTGGPLLSPRSRRRG